MSYMNRFLKLFKESKGEEEKPKNNLNTINEKKQKENINTSILSSPFTNTLIYKEFLTTFESSDYDYLINPKLLKEEYAHLATIPSSVIENLYKSIQSTDKDMWLGIMENKNKKVKEHKRNIHLKEYWIKFSSLSNQQKEFYYYFRQESLKGKFIQADLSYVYLFIYECLYYQLSNNPGLVISLVQATHEFYRHNAAYKQSLDRNIPGWVEALLMECNEVELASQYMKKYNKQTYEPLIQIMEKDIEVMSMTKSVTTCIKDYENEFYLPYRTKLNKDFKHLCKLYEIYKNQLLYDMFVYEDSSKHKISAFPFENANCHRQLSHCETKVIHLSIRNEINLLLTDLYRLAYTYQTKEKVILNYLSKEEALELLRNLTRIYKEEQVISQEKKKEKEHLTKKETVMLKTNEEDKDGIKGVINKNNQVEQAIQKFFGKDTKNIQPSIKKELNNIVNQNKKAEIRTNKEYLSLLNQKLTYDIFKSLFKEVFYEKEIAEKFTDTSIVQNSFSEEVWKAYYQSIKDESKTSFFYKLMMNRNKEILRFQPQMMEELQRGIANISMLKEYQANAYLYYKDNALKGSFIKNVDSSYVYLLLSECMHFNLSSNPQRILGFLKEMLNTYTDKELQIQIQFYIQSLLMECNESVLAKDYILTITHYQSNNMKEFTKEFDVNRINKINFSELSNINSIKSFITIYSDIKKNKTLVNRYFKELLAVYEKEKDVRLQSSYIKETKQEKKVLKPYKKLLLYRQTPTIVYLQSETIFDRERFSECLTSIYQIANTFVLNEVYEGNFPKEDILLLETYLISNYKKKTKAELKNEEEAKKNQDFVENFFVFDNQEIQGLMNLHGVKKEEEQQLKKKEKTKTLEKFILEQFLSIFEDDACEVNVAEEYAKKEKTSLNKLIQEVQKQLGITLSIEDDMIYKD